MGEDSAGDGGRTMGVMEREDTIWIRIVSGITGFNSAEIRSCPIFAEFSPCQALCIFSGIGKSK